MEEGARKEKSDFPGSEKEKDGKTTGAQP